MLQAIITERFLKALEHLEYGQFDVTTPDGRIHSFRGDKDGAHGTLIIKDWSVVYNLARKGDIGFAEDYQRGLWDTEDLCNLLLMGLQNEKALNKYIYGGFFSRLIARLSYVFKLNTLKGSKRNIHAHYDLGNDFYTLWLDPSMTYSSALFTKDGESLQQGQYNKYDRILERFEAKPGNLLEVGCGWGGFAERSITRNHDYGIKGITLSNQQHDYANNRLQGQAQIALEDYRNQDGTYDYLVSIEMFEAVGERYWKTYFQKLQSLLKQTGKAVVQTITIDERYFERYREGGDVIRSYIFPGGMLPSPERFQHEASRAGLRVTDSFAFGHDYAKTLKEWLEVFDHKYQQVKALGFDDHFIRLWRFYLAACFASFMVGRTDVMQMELQHV